jgi:hypothetical protein
MKFFLAGLLVTATMIFQNGIAAEPNWKLVVVFNEVDVGGHTRARESNDRVWIQKGPQFKTLLGQLKDAKREANQGTKNKFFTQSKSTSGSPYSVIFEYRVMKTMRKGPDKVVKGLTLKSGKYVGQIQSSFRNSDSAKKYSGIKIVEIIDMSAAKAFLNNPRNKANPYIGRIPAPVKASPCAADLWSKACKEFQNSRVTDPSAIGVRG